MSSLTYTNIHRTFNKMKYCIHFDHKTIRRVQRYQFIQEIWINNIKVIKNIQRTWQAMTRLSMISLDRFPMDKQAHTHTCTTPNPCLVLTFQLRVLAKVDNTDLRCCQEGLSHLNRGQLLGGRSNLRLHVFNNTICKKGFFLSIQSNKYFLRHFFFSDISFLKKASTAWAPTNNSLFYNLNA